MADSRTERPGALTEDRISGVISAANVTGWHKGMEVLAVRRAHVLLGPAGAPGPIVRSPRVASEAAVDFLLDLERAMRAAKEDRDWIPRARELVERFFAAISDGYGVEASEELRAWLERYYLDHTRRMRYWAWNTVLPQLAGLYGAQLRESSPLGAPASGRFTTIVRRRFDPLEFERLDAAREHLRREPVSELESDLFDRRDAEAELGVELGDAGDDLQEVIRLERTRLAWIEIERELSADERAALLRWGRAEGTAANFPEELLHDPPL